MNKHSFLGNYVWFQMIYSRAFLVILNMHKSFNFNLVFFFYLTQRSAEKVQFGLFESVLILQPEEQCLKSPAGTIYLKAKPGYLLIEVHWPQYQKNDCTRIAITSGVITHFFT